ncbi:hypothetical protein [Kitasatospora sp. P5_F3]
MQNGSRLIPTVHGLAITGDTQSDSTFNLIVGPDRAWSENGDTGAAGAFSRAALPFALVDRNQNCVHKGELSFLFNATHHLFFAPTREEAAWAAERMEISWPCCWR